VLRVLLVISAHAAPARGAGPRPAGGPALPLFARM